MPITALSLDRRIIRIVWGRVTLQKCSRFDPTLSRFHGRSGALLHEGIGQLDVSCLILLWANEFGGAFHERTLGTLYQGRPIITESKVSKQNLDTFLSKPPLPTAF
jgi:hypothetical protein